MLSELDMGPVISRRRGGGATSIPEDTVRTLGLGLGLGLVPGRAMLPLNEDQPGGVLATESSTEGGPEAVRDENNQLQVRLLVLRERLHQAMYN